MSLKHTRRRYRFDKGLATGQKLDILANDPTLAALAATELPGLGEKTNGSITDARGMMVFGAASVLWGSDRRAEVELADQWPIRRPIFDKAGIRTSIDAPNAAAWQYYRDRYLTEDVVANLKETLRDLWVGQARKMGLFPKPIGQHDWLNTNHLHTVYADGTWFAPASGVGIRGQKSRAAENGQPRLSEDVDERGRAAGYCHVFTMARRQGDDRMRLVLDFERARRGDELPVVLESLRRVHHLAEDGLRHFVYDRALNSHDQVKEIVAMGILPIGKPAGLDAFHDWRKVLGSEVEPGALTFDLDWGGCTHRVAMTHGMMWNLKNRRGRWLREKRADISDIRRVKREDGSFAFLLDLRMRCGPRWHDFTVDLCAPLTVDGGRREVDLAAHLKPHPVADIELISNAYSVRNDVESEFSRFKNHMGIGPRAGSFTALGHEIDLLLLSLTVNALAWAEWRQDYAKSTVKYRVTRCLTSPRMSGVLTAV